jgi:hypothetical protein
MCNLYSITTNQAAIIALFRVINRYVGNLPPMPGVFPDYLAPVIRNTDAGTEMVTMRWGMPPPPRRGGPRQDPSWSFKEGYYPRQAISAGDHGARGEPGTAMDVGGWLRGLGLEQYEAAFRDNKIDEVVLPRLTAIAGSGLLPTTRSIRVLTSLCPSRLRARAVTCGCPTQGASNSGRNVTINSPRRLAI